VAKPKAKVQIVVDVKTAKAVSSIKGMVRQNNQLMRRMVQDTQRGASGMTKLQASIVSINAALDLAGKAFGMFSRTAGAAIGLMRDAAAERTNIRQLGFAFASVEMPVEASLAAIERFATAQQAATRFGDTATRNIARQFTIMSAGVVTDINQIIQATGLVQDIVEAGVVRNARGATRAIAQLYGGNLEAINSLLPAQQAHFREMVRTEGAAAAATAALIELNRMYGGTAASIDETDQRLAALTNGWGDFKEQLGGILADLAVEQNVFDRILEGLNGMIGWVDSNGAEVLEFMSSMANMAANTARMLARIEAPSGVSELRGAVNVLTQLPQDPITPMAQAERERSLSEVRSLLAQSPTDRVTAEQEQIARELRDVYGFTFQEIENTLMAAALQQYDPEAAAESAASFLPQVPDVPGGSSASARARQRAAERAAQRQATFLAGGGGVLGMPLETAQTGLQGLAQMLTAVGAPQGPMDQAVERTNALNEALGRLGESALAGGAAAMGAAGEWHSFFISLEQGAVSTSIRMARTLGGAMTGAAVDTKSIFAGMFDTLGAAASAAAAAQASVSAMFPFLGLAIGASVFSGMLGAGGKSPPRRTSGAATTATEDVFTGLRPEADRGGRTILVQQSFGAVFNTDDTRREISRLRDEAITMGEARVANG